MLADFESAFVDTVNTVNVVKAVNIVNVVNVVKQDDVNAVKG